MSTNYSEQIFQAVDTIVSQRLNEVSFDKTEICKIVSEDTSTEGKYWVTNDVLRFEAYSTDPGKSYTEGQKVYVTIPSGDYSMRKIIIGSYSSDEIPKNLYTNPFDHLIASSEISIPTSNLKVTAKKDGTETIKSVTKTGLTFHYSGLGQFNYIGLDFSATTGFGGTIGEFQIMIDLLDSSGVSLLTNEQKGLLTFSSRQLYGNPYYLTPALHFQHLFNFPLEYNNIKFSDLTKVKQIKVTLRSLGNFNYPNTAITTDININSLKLYFGFDSTEDSMSENTVALVLDNPVNGLEYSTVTDEKEMSIDWRNLTTNAIYNETENKQYPTVGEYQIYWLQYSESIGYTKKLEKDGGIDIDESGTYWKTVQKKDANTAAAYTYTLSPCADWKKEQIKVIIKHKNGDYIESKGLTFTNKNFRSETGSNQGSKDTLRLSLAEGDDGVYNSYGIDNKLLTSYNLEHSLTVDYIDNTEWNKDLQKVIWKIPKNATMIKQPDGWSTQGNFYVLEVNHDTSLTDGGKTIKFKLSDQFSYNKTNNTIYCEIIRYKDKNSGIKTDEYQGSITLQFGLQGTNGTGWSFNIISSQRALTNKETGQNKMTLTATLEDSEGKPIDDSSWANKVKWSWYQTQYDTSNTDRKYSMSETTGKTTVITRKSYIDCYAIVQAKLEDWQDKNGNKIDLVAYLPIAAGNPSHYLTGAARVIYNNAGTSPSYDEAPYILYKSDHTVVNSKDYTYSIISSETNKNKYFTINTKEGNLKPLSLLPTQIPKMALQVYDDKNKQVRYVQPILILKNGYQSKMLNEWDGNLKIDNENNSIFSALMGAGKKNDDNTFTGILMGTVGKTISGAKTGIYGMQNGELRFAFDERGAAYVGTGDDNKIAFNGLGGTGSEELEINAKKFNLFVAEDSSYNLLSSKPSDWNNNYTKFYVKKDNKYILNTNSTWKNNTYYKLVPELYIGNSGININNKSAWLSFKDKIHFYKDGTVTIGGWTVGTSSLSWANSDTTKQDYTRWLYFGTTNSAKLKWIDNKEKSVALRLGDDFGVTSNGILYAKNGNFSGTINATKLTLSGDASSEFTTLTENTIKTTTVTAQNLIVKAAKIDGQLEAEQIKVSAVIKAGSADITGIVKATEISANKITSGKLDAKYIDATNLTVKNANIESLSFSKVTGSSNNAISASNLSITGGSINMYPNPGYLVFGTSVSNHPYVSALNVAHGSGGIVICNGQSRDNVGAQIGYIDAGSGQYLRILTAEGKNMNITGRADVALEISEKSSHESKGCLKIATNPYHESGDGSMGSNPGSIYIYSHAHITLHAGHKNNAGNVYVGHGASGNSRVATDSSGPSSLNLKTNLQKFDDKTYNEALQLLSDLQLYNYTYKYNNLHPKKEQFGFVIDELLENELANKFFYFRDEVAGITQSNNINYAALDEGNPYNEPIIHFKRYDEETLIKYLLVCNKALLQQIEGLKHEIKEIKQNEI